MAKTSQSPYAKAYSFGTDGSAALAGSPISSHRPVNTPRNGVQRKGRGTWIHRWLFYGFFFLLVIILCAVYLDGVSQQQALDRELQQLQVDILAVQGQLQGLEEELRVASDEKRIRSIAVNRLGMQQPTEDQIVRMPAAEAPASLLAENTDAAQQEGMGFIRLLLSTLGL